jgi:excisionase family DNA binding protein
MKNHQSSEVTVAEAARQLGIGLQYAYSLVYSGRLPARRVDGRWHVSADAVEERRKRLEARSGAH